MRIERQQSCPEFPSAQTAHAQAAPAREVDRFVGKAVTWQAAYAGLAASVHRLSVVIERPLTEFDRQQAQKKPYFDRGSWQDTLAFGARSSWRRAYRCRANGKPVKGAAYSAAAGLGFGVYALGGFVVTIAAGGIREGLTGGRGSVYSKPRSDDGVREDIAGRALGGLRSDLVRCMEEPIPRALASAEVRAMASAAHETLARFKAQIDAGSPHLRGSRRLDEMLKVIDSRVDDLRAFARSC